MVSRSDDDAIPTKMIVLGDERVGKTSLTIKFTTGQFDDSQPVTLNASYHSKKIDVKDGRKMELQIWDTAGQERYHALN